MKDLHLIIWLTQLGLNVALPLAGFVLLGVWLHKNLNWGVWTIWAGIAIGLICAVDGFRTCLKTLNRIGNRPKEPEPPTVAFNDHD